MTDDKCTRCGSELVAGKSIRNTLSGIGDFHDGDQVATVSAGGSGEYIDSLKCSNQSCGRQFEIDNPTREKSV